MESRVYKLEECRVFREEFSNRKLPIPSDGPVYGCVLPDRALRWNGVARRLV